jgi:plasmid stability protein
MANLTITVDDDLLRRARIRAAEEDTSVNAVLRDELKRFAGEPGLNAAASFLDVARSRSGSSGAGGRDWTRDDLHLERFDR